MGREKGHEANDRLKLIITLNLVVVTAEYTLSVIEECSRYSLQSMAQGSNMTIPDGISVRGYVNGSELGVSLSRRSRKGWGK
jgi:hypothetical protein